MTEFIGIDIGGTNIRIGKVDETGNITYLHKEKTLENVNSQEELYLKILNIIKNVPDNENANAIGIGVPGAISNDLEIKTARNIEYLKDFPLVKRLENDLKKKAYIENDAKVAALGEAILGAGKGKNIVCYITISTGLGGGIVIDNKIYHGANNIGGYFSRMILDGKNISEHLISGTALINKGKEFINKDISSTQEIFELAINKNEVAMNIVEEFKKYLTVLLLNISITINPDIIVLGGGVMKSKEYFLEEVKEQYYNKAHTFAKSTEIKEAMLDEPGVIGAGLMCKDK